MATRCIPGPSSAPCAPRRARLRRRPAEAARHHPPAATAEQPQSSRIRAQPPMAGRRRGPGSSPRSLSGGVTLARRPGGAGAARGRREPGEHSRPGGPGAPAPAAARRPGRDLSLPGRRLRGVLLRAHHLRRPPRRGPVLPPGQRPGMHFYCTDSAAALGCQPSSPRTSTPFSARPPRLTAGRCSPRGRSAPPPGRGPPTPDPPPSAGGVSRPAPAPPRRARPRPAPPPPQDGSSTPRPHPGLGSSGSDPTPACAPTTPCPSQDGHPTPWLNFAPHPSRRTPCISPRDPPGALQHPRASPGKQSPTFSRNIPESS